ncbi:hypothetical protein YTPLAS21_16940 [Candidatus Nitrosocosmicus sp.]|nr:hypothetical protein YTPLAS21_16940 [Candidatus Nitrosocosmicus sp.]
MEELGDVRIKSGKNDCLLTGGASLGPGLGTGTGTGTGTDKFNYSSGVNSISAFSKVHEDKRRSVRGNSQILFLFFCLSFFVVFI